MRTRYLYHCPRGFANEFACYRITTLDELRTAQCIIDRHDADTSGRAYFVRRSEAEARTRAARQARKAYDRAGLSQEIVGATEIIDLGQRHAPV